MKLKTTLIALALVSGSAVAGPVQWNSVDNLVTATASLQDTFDRGLKRVGGYASSAGAGHISPDGYLEVSATLVTTAQKDAYNAAIGEVQNDIFSKTAEEYFGEEYVNAQNAMDAAIDTYVAAATPLAVATHISNMAQQVQLSGDAVQGQQLQAYVTNNNVLMTQTNVVDYNNSLVVLQDAADQFAGVAAVYNDPQLIQNFQSMADADGVDFLNADGLFLDRIENQNITGMQAALVVDFTSMNSTMYVQDVAANLVTTEFLNQAGANSTFYLTGPTQDINTTCSTVQNGTIFQTYQTQDPDMPCFIEPMP